MTKASTVIEAQEQRHRARNEKWDTRFLQMASLVSTWSKDPSTKTGGVIVRPNKSIVSVGFNGFPRKIADTEELLNDRPEKLRRMVHSELNAILSTRESLEGYTLYNWPGQSCERCAVHVIQAGIVRVVSYWDEESSFIQRWMKEMKDAEALYLEANVEVVYVTPKDMEVMRMVSDLAGNEVRVKALAGSNPVTSA